MSLVKRISRSRAFQKTVGVVAAEYLRLVWKTSTSIVIDPPDLYERMARDWPVIVAMWHGQHFLMPFLKRKDQRAKVLVSRHRDGEINAIVAECLNVGTIRGSGAHDRDFARKGGVTAFRQILTALEEGYSVAVTADVPKVSRVAGRGIVMLASMSGRPIMPVAVVTSHRKELDNWDRSAVVFPFGRSAIVAGDMIHVPKGETGDFDVFRKQVEDGLNRVERRGYGIVDRREPTSSAG